MDRAEQTGQAEDSFPCLSCTSIGPTSEEGVFTNASFFTKEMQNHTHATHTHTQTRLTL